MASKAQFIADLKTLGREKSFKVIVDAKKLESFSSDKSVYAAHLPCAAARPDSLEAVASVVKLCVQHSVPMTPQGAASGLEGGCIPRHGGCVIDTSKLRRFDIDKANSCVWVGAGWKKLELLKKVHREGLHFGPDPASNPSVGGMCSTGGSGMSTLKYGTTRENVLSLRVVTPSGAILQTRQVVRKSSTGLDLTQLYCGSEGTLGVIGEICFKLHKKLDFIAGGIAQFETTADAVKSVVEIRQRGNLHSLIRCELLNKGAVEVSNQELGTTLPVAPTVLLEFADSEPSLESIHRDFAVLEEIFRSQRATSVRFLKDGEELESVWEARRGCLLAAGKYRKRKGEKILNTDVCVPLSALSDTVVSTEEDFAKAVVPCVICAHIADGNFHCFIPFQTPEEKQRALSLEFRMVRRAISNGGSASGEHGVGVGKVKHLLAEHGAHHIAVQENIKKALDPHNLMNPGAFYPSQVAVVTMPPAAGAKL
jgi:D-lactate dehydrogenase (cytochrome)